MIAGIVIGVVLGVVGASGAAFAWLVKNPPYS